MIVFIVYNFCLTISSYHEIGKVRNITINNEKEDKRQTEPGQ